MRILLSAYSCDPNLGSEAAVGWNWLVTLARLGHKVLLLCRTVDAPGIRAGLANLPERRCITIHTYDPPWFPTRAKTSDRFIRFHCLLWQIGAHFWLRQRIRQLHPDVIHHITWGVVRLPCLLGSFGVPMVFGPAGGGDTIPLRLRYKFTLGNHLYESVRNTLNRLVTIDPLMRFTFSHASVIAARTDETRRLIPRRYREKVVIYPELGIDQAAIADRPRLPPSGGQRPLRVLFVGRLRHFKGVNYVIEAFSRFHRHHGNAELTVVGQGADADRLKRSAVALGIAQHIRWIDRVEHSRMADLYQAHDILLFPSLRDSGGCVVLEALSNGLPVITLDLGGPKQVVTDSCGRVVGTCGLHPAEVIERLAENLDELSDPALRGRLATSALERAAEFISERRIGRFYEIVGAAIGLTAPDSSIIQKSSPLDREAIQTRVSV